MLKKQKHKNVIPFYDGECTAVLSRSRAWFSMAHAETDVLQLFQSNKAKPHSRGIRDGIREAAVYKHRHGCAVTSNLPIFSYTTIHHCW